MATFDPQAILDAVDTGSGSEPWTFYRARKSSLLDQVCIISAQSLMMIFFASVLVASSIGLYFGGSPDAGTRIYVFVFIVAGLVCGIIALMLGWGGITLLRQMRTITSQVIVLTPEGFVARTGQRPNKLFLTFPPPCQLWNGSEPAAHKSMQRPMTSYKEFCLSSNHHF